MLKILMCNIVDCQEIHTVDYEDDLDMLWTSSTQYGAEPSHVVRFYDNCTGTLLREIRLDAVIEADYVSLLFYVRLCISVPIFLLFIEIMTDVDIITVKKI